LFQTLIIQMSVFYFEHIALASYATFSLGPATLQCVLHYFGMSSEK